MMLGAKIVLTDFQGPGGTVLVIIPTSTVFI